MALLSSKHPNAQQIVFTDFSGGLNLSRPPESIATNEAQVLSNFEFDPATGTLKARPGMVFLHELPAPITSLASIPRTGKILAETDQKKFYVLDDYSTSQVGMANGDGEPIIAPWDEEKALIATGKSVQALDLTAMTLEDTGSPDADYVYTRVGRAAIVKAGTDDLNMSGIGDYANWNFEGTDADAIYTEIGYKDGCDITAVANLASDVVFFKAPPAQSHFGRIYRLVGEYPNWVLKQVAQVAVPLCPQSAIPVANDVFYTSADGVANLQTVQTYGDVKVAFAGAKVNPRLSKYVTGDEVRMWHIPRKSQVWVRPNSGPSVWVFHYAVGEGGAWVTFSFPNPLTGMAVIDDNVYVSMGSRIYRLDDNALDDNGEAINASWMPRTIMAQNQVLLKGIYVAYKSFATTEANLSVDKLVIDLPLGGQSEYAAEDPDIAAEDDDYLVPYVSAQMRKRCQIRRWNFSPKLNVARGGFKLSAVGLDYAEV